MRWKEAPLFPPRGNAVLPRRALPIPFHQEFEMAINDMIWLTELDYNRLKHLLADLTRQSRGMQAGLEMLENILDFARVVHSERVPENVVTMNSQVLFEDVRTRENGTVTVVYPADADPSANRISVL